MFIRFKKMADQRINICTETIEICGFTEIYYYNINLF